MLIYVFHYIPVVASDLNHSTLILFNALKIYPRQETTR